MSEAVLRLTAHPASFRDPNARIYASADEVLRALSGKAVDNFRFARDSGLLARLEKKGWIVESEEVDRARYDFEPGSQAAPTLLIRHPRIPYISHPYEWPFRALQRAALLHLELHLKAMEAGVTLSDATAYNVQFNGPNPVFIDVASLERYREGQVWMGHRQFCEQFLNPLLLHAHAGAPYHAWYRGALEGIPADQLARVLPWRARFDWRVFAHVLLQARMQSSASHKRVKDLQALRTKRLSRTAFTGLLQQLYGWIKGLKPAGIGATTWAEYEKVRSYDAKQQQERMRFVTSFVDAVRPKMLWDLGCNAGEFSLAALRAGAERVIGFDFDHGALAVAFERAEQSGLSFLPLFLDAANPSPSQGWQERERLGFEGRATCDAILALAFEHHLAIGRNVPLPEFVEWLLRLAPRGVVEFVDKKDPQVERMLALREDIFPNYSVEAFRNVIQAKARIHKELILAGSSRTLFWYERLE